MFLSCRCTGTLVFLCCHPGRLSRDVSGRGQTHTLCSHMSSGSWVMFLSCRCTGTLVFLCCHPGRLSRDVAMHGPKVGGAKPIPCAHICQVGHG